MTELAALVALPRALLLQGYVDAVLARGALRVGAVQPEDLTKVGRPAATLLALFSLHGEVPRADAEAVLGAAPVAGLCRLGVLVEREGRLHSGRLVALPTLGQLALLPSPPGAPRLYLGEDVVTLLMRLVPVRGRCLVVGSGVGLLAMRAALSASEVVAVEHDPVAVGCAELNFAMSGLAQRVQGRSGTLYEALPPGERFDHVVLCAPGAPVPVLGSAAFQGLDGPAAAARLLAGLPEVLAPGGLCQMTAAVHGTEAGPSFGVDVADLARKAELELLVSVRGRQRLSPGSPLFESLVRRSVERSRVAETEVRRLFADHLAARGAAFLYFVQVTASRRGAPATASG